jgi:hypothetical protein
MVQINLAHRVVKLGAVATRTLPEGEGQQKRQGGELTSYKTFKELRQADEKVIKEDIAGPKLQAVQGL